MKKLIFLAVVLFSYPSIAVPADGEKRTAQKTVEISATTDIKIEGKNTYIEIETWDKNEVFVEAEIIFNGRMTDKMTKFLTEFEEKVKEKIYISGGTLTIDTDLKEPNKVQIGSRNVGLVIGYGDKDLRLSYRIKLPGENELNVKCAYQDLVMNGTYDEVDVSQYSADLSGGTFKKAKLDLKYGDANIESIHNLDLEAYEEELEVQEIKSLKGDVKYSQLELGESDEITLTGYESDFELGNVEMFRGNLKYADIEIEGKLGLGVFSLYESHIAGEAAGNITVTESKYSSIGLDRANQIKLESSYEDKIKIRYLNNFISPKSKYGQHTIEQLGGKVELIGYEDKIQIEAITSSASHLNMDGKYLTLILNISESNFKLNADLKYGKLIYDESDVDVRKYIKENDNLKLEIFSKNISADPFEVSLKGYEVDVDID